MSIVAALQMHSNHILEDNLKLAHQLISKAHDSGAKLVVLPESFSYYGFNYEDKLKSAELHGDGQVQSFLAQMAEQYKLWVVGGTVFIRNPDHSINITTFVYDTLGREVARYNKIHLFRANLSTTERYCEADLVTPGSNVVVLDTPFGRLGLSVCFDLRFPRLYEQFKSRQTDFIVAPSAFVHSTGRFHWEVLIRARALDCFSYMIAPGLVGLHTNGYQTHGHTMIVDPWGQIINQLSEPQSGIVLAELDLNMVKQVREKIIREDRLP